MPHPPYRVIARTYPVRNQDHALHHRREFRGRDGHQGVFEETVGRVTAWLRGPVRAPEDEFALKVADDYALFLRQTPWYRFPFGAKLKAFWAETPLVGGNLVRKTERRGSLSVEYAVKAVYAKALGALAGLDPAPLKIRSVVSRLDKTDTDVDARITVIKTLDDGRTIIETPHYRTFTEIILGLAGRGRNFTEIAGNDDILGNGEGAPWRGDGLLRRARSIRGSDSGQTRLAPRRA
jgi:hypothetical protein